MSDIENLDVMLGSYQRDESEAKDRNDDNEIDSGSIRRKEGLNRNEKDFRSYLNTNLSESSCLTVEPSRAISSEISSQMSRTFEEMQKSLNSQILDIIIAAIETRMLPSIKNAVGSRISAKNTNFGQMGCIRVT